MLDIRFCTDCGSKMRQLLFPLSNPWHCDACDGMEVEKHLEPFELELDSLLEGFLDNWTTVHDFKLHTELNAVWTDLIRYPPNHVIWADLNGERQSCTAPDHNKIFLTSLSPKLKNYEWRWSDGLGKWEYKVS